MTMAKEALEYAYYKDFRYEDKGENWQSVTHEFVDETRWGIIYSKVIKFSDDSYIEIVFEDPATEMQEGGDYDDIDGYLVEPREVVTIIYEKVKE